MNPQEHERAAGVLHVIYGGLNAVMLLLLALFFLAGDGRGLTRLPEMLVLFTGAAWLLLGCLPLAAGYGLLRGRPWARAVGIAASALAALSFPFGTALAAYSFWFFFGPGRRLEEARRLRAARAAAGEAPGYGWEARLPHGEAPRLPRREEYVKPPEPYGWRGED